MPRTSGGATCLRQAAEEGGEQGVEVDADARRGVRQVVRRERRQAEQGDDGLRVPLAEGRALEARRRARAPLAMPTTLRPSTATSPGPSPAKQTSR